MIRPSAGRAACLVTAALTVTFTMACAGASAADHASATSAKTAAQPKQVRISGAGSSKASGAHYRVPSHNVFFVSTTGTDKASGRAHHPWRTISHAVKTAPSGATLVVRQGTYHEDVVFPVRKSFTLQAFPHEAVYLDGSVPVTGWRQAGANEWVHDHWMTHFPVYSDPPNASANFRRISSSYPMAGHPDEAFLDGQELNQVASASQLKPGTFAVDTQNHQLLLGSNPAGHAVRASTLSQALFVQQGGANSVIRGITIQRYATPIQDGGTVKLFGTGTQMVNDSVLNNAGVGIQVGATNVQLHHDTVDANGELGIGGNEADNLSVRSSQVTGNNREHFKIAPVSGGIKCTSCRYASVALSVISQNLGDGVWFDKSSYQDKVIANIFQNNLGPVLHFEVSDAAIFANNYINGCGDDGIQIADATNADIWNNTVLGCPTAIAVLDGPRVASNAHDPGHDPRYPRDPNQTWVTAGVQVYNNVLGGNEKAPVIEALDYNHKRNGEALRQGDHNLYRLTGTGSSAQFAQWSTGKSSPAILTLHSLSNVQGSTGEEDHSAAAGPTGPPNRMIGGTPPNSVAQADGSPSGKRVPVGSWVTSG